MPIFNTLADTLSKTDPFGTDRTPRVLIEIAGKMYPSVEEYSYESNILSFGDPFSLALPAPDGIYAGTISIGSPVNLYIADPNVQGGKQVKLLKGLITARDSSSDTSSGTKIKLTGSDLSWHLANNSGHLWKNLRSSTFQSLLSDPQVISPDWGFLSPAKLGNAANRALKQGRAGIIEPTIRIDQPLPRIQFEPGQMIADVFVLYAKRLHLLVNVSSEGQLQIFQPGYEQPSSYTFHYHAKGDKRNAQNNVKSATLHESIDGMYTEVTCVGTKVFQIFVDPTNQNDGKFRATYNNLGTLPFARRLAFADQEPLSQDQALGRAKWKFQRGLFDSWEYQITVFGHSQNGTFYAPDTMCSVYDSINGLNGSYYISAVKYSRNAKKGTETTLTIKKPNLLAAG